jgi:glycosyltransferase involved in cell wall biosynthesis
MKVTVLVAVYNTEKYLHKSLDSLLAQTYTDLEILCVDDGSSDGSLEILHEYAERDKRIQVFHLNENKGPAVARNTAISHSTGDLVAFLDSDDWLSPTSIAQTVEVFQRHPETDCVLMRLVKVQADGTEKEYTMDAHFPMTGKEAFERSLNWRIHGVYMVRGDIQRRIPYDDTCRSYSDDNTTRLHYLSARQVDLSPGTYFYRQHPQSISHVSDISQFDFLKANEHMQQLLTELGVEPRLLDMHEEVRWRNLIACYLFYFQHRTHFSTADRQYALCQMRHAWQQIETKNLPRSLRSKFGHIPTPWWWLFRVEEEIYFSLRRLFSTNTGAR